MKHIETLLGGIATLINLIGAVIIYPVDQVVGSYWAIVTYCIWLATINAYLDEG